MVSIIILYLNISQFQNFADDYYTVCGVFTQFFEYPTFTFITYIKGQIYEGICARILGKFAMYMPCITFINCFRHVLRLVRHGSMAHW